MSPRSRRGRLVAGLLSLTSLLALVLAGCSLPGGDDELLGPDPGQLRYEQQALLDQRAKAIRTHNLSLFLQSLDRSDKAFVKRQRQVFANLSQLPLQTYAYRVESTVWPADLLARRWGKDASVPHVRVLVRFEGYDDRATHSETGFVFAPRNGQLLLVSDRTGAGEPFPGATPAPWEITRIHVRDTGDVLALFDDPMWASAGTVVDAVEDGIRQVSRGLPFTWDRKVVVYSFARRDVLNSFEGVPGGNIRHLGALTFAVYGAGRDPVGMRFAVLPSSVKAGQPFLGRIVRHELTHVALGDRDDGVPTWLTEGIAEYIGARDLPEGERRIASVAVSRASEEVTSMPGSATFNGEDQDWHYALSWIACDLIADTQGESALWNLVDRLHNGGAGTPDNRQDRVLREVLGYDSHQLARRAAARILQIYG